MGHCRLLWNLFGLKRNGHKQAGQSSYPFTQADILLSRSEDVLWFEDDNGKRDFLHPLAVEGICVEGLLDYQFRKTDKDVGT